MDIYFNVGNNTAYLDFEVIGQKEGDHLYTNESESPSGYSLTQSAPVFHVLKERYKVRLSQFIVSILLVIQIVSNNKPSAPDGPGNGERQYLNDNGYVFQM